MSASDGTRRAVVGVSCPGGMARQFRVQVCSSESPSHWKLAGSFRDVEGASECARRLARAGAQTRVVACRALPTAA
jgi:hypothetical protein